MNKIYFYVIFQFMIISQLLSVNYYVDNNNPAAGNSNPGTFELPLLTIQAAVNKANSPGDIIYVRSGTYDEKVTCSHSGSKDDGFINIVAYPGDPKPVMRGFEISSKSYIRLIGFEITHENTQYSHAVVMAYGCSHIEVLDNYIHHIVGAGVRWYNHFNTYITVRGNEMYMLACPSNSPGECKGNGWAVGFAGGNHNLIEYNIAHRVGDFINIGNDTVIVRNNYLYDFNNSYWTDGPGDALHADMFQPCGSPMFPSRYQVYESNFMGDNIESNSHILQMRTANSDDHNIIFRGNVGYNHGSYAMQCGGVDNVYYYNNTIHEINTLSPTNPGIGYNSEGSDLALNNQNFNNIFSEFGNGTRPPIAVENDCVIESSNNLCHLSGNHSSCISSGDPKFQNIINRDYYLNDGSSAINAGKAITIITSPEGSGLTFDVENSELFCDGFGITDGDLINVAGKESARIIKINDNKIKIDRSISWKQNDGIYWRNQDTLPDAGAYEFNFDGYDYDITITDPLNNSEVNGNITINALSNNPKSIRFVVFYINGIPVYQDFDPPFSFIWNTGNTEFGNKIIEARAYPLYASKTLVKCDTINISINPTNIVDYKIIQDNLLIFPNPAADIFIIQYNGNIKDDNTELILNIYDLNGVLVDELKSHNGIFIWDNDKITNGIYTLILKYNIYYLTRSLVLIR